MEPDEQWLDETTERVKRDVLRLGDASEVLLRDANPPKEAGVYIFVMDGEAVYVGEARSSGGLWDRIMNKHLSGDEGHTLQRAFKDQIPNRYSRREYLKDHVAVKWITVDDPDRVSVIERLVIQMLKPRWNRA